MPTPELIHCVAIVSGSVDRHIVKTTRHREPDGAATKHTHIGTTLCGAKVKGAFPFLSALIQVKSRFRCEDCAGMFCTNELNQEAAALR